jgi:hypothetical protein
VRAADNERKGSTTYATVWRDRTVTELNLEETGAWLQARLQRNVWISVSAGEQRSLLSGQGELRYEPGHLDIQEWIGREAETERGAHWYRQLTFLVGPAFRLHLGENFRGATEGDGLLHIRLDEAEVTLTDDFWTMFNREARSD